MHAVREGVARGEDWAAVDTADLGGGGHADLGDKCVIKKAENLLLLHLLGWGVFGRRRDRWAFPELWASKGGSMGGVAEHSMERQRQSQGYVSQSLPDSGGKQTSHCSSGQTPREQATPREETKTGGPKPLCEKKGERGRRQKERG